MILSYNIQLIMTNNLYHQRTGQLLFQKYFWKDPKLEDRTFSIFIFQKSKYIERELFVFEITMRLQINQFLMPEKTFILTLAIIFVKVSTISLTRHKSFSETCLYIPIGDLFQQRTFNYTIIQAWTAEQKAKIKSKALNSSDFIRVEGYKPSGQPNNFYSFIENKTAEFKHKLTFVKKVLEASDAPEFGLSDYDIDYGFGNPAKVIIAKVPQGKALITFNSQAAVTSLSNRFAGYWSIPINLVDMRNLEEQLKSAAQRVQRQIKVNHLTTREFLVAADIRQQVVTSSLLLSFETSPAEGTFGLVKYSAFVYAIREGEEVLLGPIDKGQPGILQIMDLVKNRTSCA